MAQNAYLLASECSLEIIDLTNIEHDLNLILRDDVHTTSYGADRISGYILNFCKTLLSLPLSDLCRLLAFRLRSYVKGFTFFTSVLAFKPTEISTLSWRCQVADQCDSRWFGTSFSILLEHIVGPHSPPCVTTHILAASVADPVSPERGFRSINYNTDIADIYSRNYSRKTVTVLGDGLWMDVPIQITTSIDPAHSDSRIIPLRLFGDS